MQLNTISFICVVVLLFISCDNAKSDKEKVKKNQNSKKIVMLESAEITDLKKAKEFITLIDSQNPKSIQDGLKASGSLGTLNIICKDGNDQKRLKLNEYIGETLSKKMSFMNEPLRIKEYKNDDDEQLIKVANKELSYKINASTRMISDMKITSSDVVLNGKSISLKVGEYANGIEKYYPDQFKKRKKISRNGKTIETILIPNSEFTSTKSDIYIYADIDSNGKIVEIGSWEQY